jgi:acylglycerol lipase
MRHAGNRKGRRSPWAVGLASAGLLAWAAYKVSNPRRARATMAADDSCETDPGAAANMSRFTPGAPPIGCRPWDIGTGVTGYVWHSPEPRAVLLLQHGYGEYARRFVGQYNQLIPHLLNMGVSVYAFDMWGSGHSPGRRGLTDVGQAVEDHLTARRKLREQPLPVFLLGHSLGGLVTASSVARDQGGLSGVVLMSAALQHDASQALLAFAKVAAFFAPTARAPVKAASLSLLYRGAEQDARLAGDPLFYRGRLPMLVAGTGGNIAHDNWNLYPDWEVPVLLMHGTADTWTDPRGSQRLFEAVASEDKSLHLVEGGYHELLNDTGRDETLRTLLAWLERRLPTNRE